MILEIVTLAVLALLLYVVLYIRTRVYVIIAAILIVVIVGYVLWRIIGKIGKGDDEALESVEGFKFNFAHDAENVAERPEIYCGDSTTLPSDYDEMGTRAVCLRKGIGLGMSLPDSQRATYLAKPPKPAPEQRLYCGNAEELPEGYDGFDTLSNCMRRGVGVGLHMPQAKRLAFQAKPQKALGKKEIMDLARRVGIKDPASMTRSSVLRSISRKLSN